MDDAKYNLNGLAIRDICAIIKAGNNCGVSLLKLGDLHIEYAPKALLAQKPVVELPSLEGALSDEQKEILRQRSLDQEEYDFRKQQLSLSFIEDPELAEKLLADGELEDDDSTGDEY